MLKLNAGLSRKVGEPDYGSRGASVNLELEVEGHLVTEPEALLDRIRKLFTLARQAVDEELNGRKSALTQNQRAAASGGTTDKPNGRPATASQVKAIRSICDQLKMDAETHIRTCVAADGSLPACLVFFEELSGRIRVCREERCTIISTPRKRQITFNGGACVHTIHTWDLLSYPSPSAEPGGKKIEIPAAELATKLAVAQRATTLTAGAYATDSVLLESDREGARLAATDGRRLVIAELSDQRGDFRGPVLLPGGVIKLFIKLLAKAPKEALVHLFIKTKPSDKGERRPAELWLTGPNWTVNFQEADGAFPKYREVIPQSQSRFIVERQALIEAIRQVGLASKVDQRVLRMELGPRRMRLAAGNTEVGESTAMVPCKFAGGGDRRIHTGFDPQFLLEALMSLEDERVVIDVQQNVLSPSGQVAGRPALLYLEGSAAVRWVVMPVTLDLAPSKAALGSNYKRPASKEQAA